MSRLTRTLTSAVAVVGLLASMGCVLVVSGDGKSCPMKRGCRHSTCRQKPCQTVHQEPTPAVETDAETAEATAD